MTAALCWGCSDFIVGMKGRQLPVAWVLTISQAIALAGSAMVVALDGSGPPGTTAVLSAAAAAIAYSIALLSFVHGAAVARIGVVATITAGGAVIPVAVGILGGEDVGALGIAGISVTLIGVGLLCAGEPDQGTPHSAARTGVALALVAAVASGAYFVGIDRSASESVAWTSLIVTGVALTVFGSIVLLTESFGPLWRRGVRQLAAIGALMLAGNLAYAMATNVGELAVVAVVAALYPAFTIGLAWMVIGERLRQSQQVGACTALLGVVLLAV